jgi:O-antigen ligase
MIALASAVVALYVGRKYGPPASAAALVGIVAVVALLANGELAVPIALSIAVLAEDDPSWGVSISSRLYSHAPSAFEAIEVLSLLAVLLHLIHTRRRPVLPSPLTPVMLLIVVAIIAGVVAGLDNGTATRSGYFAPIQGITALLIVPTLIVNVVRTPERLRLALGLGLALAVVKGLLGLFVVVAKIAPDQIGLGRITYYAPAANMLCALFLVGMLVTRLARIPAPRWAVWATPAVLACLILSQRRAIWLGSALAVLLIVFPASGRVGRRLIVPAVLVIGVFGFLALSTGITGGLQGELSNRVSSISLASISRNQQDSYRIGERENALAAIASQPFTGIGLGTEWQTRHVMSFEVPGGHVYVHFAALWWWMKMGVLGLAAYLLAMGAAIATGIRVWLRHTDPRIRAFGLAAAAFTPGLMLIELTSTVIGANERGTLVFAAMLGLLAAANAEIRSNVSRA